MTEATLPRPLSSVEETLLGTLKTIRPGLDEEEAALKLIDVSDFLEQTPQLGLMVARLAADNRVDAKPKIQLGLLTVNTVLWGPARVVSRLLSTPVSWFVGPTAFFNDAVGALYGFWRLSQVLNDLEEELLRENWPGEDDGFAEVLTRLRDFHDWSLDKKLDKAFMVLSWIP